jgi:hypothetical protein
MVKQKMDATQAIAQNIAALTSAGLQPSFDRSVLGRALSPSLAGMKSLAVTVPQDDSKETVDVVFDTETGAIIGWHKTERSKERGLVTLKMAPAFAPSDKKQVQSFIVDKVLKGAIKAIAREIDESIKPAEVLQRFDADLKLPRLKAAEKKAMQGQRVLLLVHGIFSKTEAAFQGLQASYTELAKIYGGNLIAYDHFTLSKSTRENAADLLAQLPDGVTLDIICHSRGAGVVRFLIESAANRKILQQRGIQVGTVCFVAGACEGSPLATRDAADRLFKLLAQLAALSGAQSLPFVKALGLVIRAAASGALLFPGVKAMNPAGSEVQALARSKATAATQYCYIRANFDPKNLIARFAEEAVIDKRVFRGAANDCIVPWIGASASNDYLPAFDAKHDLLGFGPSGGEQHTVWHTNFFDQKAVRNSLVNVLRQGNE